MPDFCSRTNVEISFSATWPGVFQQDWTTEKEDASQKSLEMWLPFSLQFYSQIRLRGVSWRSAFPVVFGIGRVIKTQSIQGDWAAFPAVMNTHIDHLGNCLPSIPVSGLYKDGSCGGRSPGHSLCSSYKRTWESHCGDSTVCHEIERVKTDCCKNSNYPPKASWDSWHLSDYLITNYSFAKTLSFSWYLPPLVPILVGKIPLLW